MNFVPATEAPVALTPELMRRIPSKILRIYVPGETSVRLEDAVLVTPTGAKRLTHHDKSLPIDSFR